MFMVMKKLLLLVLILAAGCTSKYPESAIAPAGTPIERDQWGAKTFGTMYTEAVQWVKSSTFIQREIGGIHTVAPIGESRCSCAFTDGCSCGLNLEVIGKNGTANLQMSGVFIDTTSRKLFVGGAIWKKDGVEVKLHKNGMTYQEYYSPKHWIQVLNKEVTSPYKIHTPFYHRAQVNFHLGNEKQALKDVASAIQILNEEAKRARIDDGSGKPKAGWTKSDADDLRECYRILGVIQAFTESEKRNVPQTVQQIQNTPLFGEDIRSGEDYLFFWVIQQHAGLEDLANRELMDFYQRRQKNILSIFTQLAPFYLNEKSFEALKTYGNNEEFYAAQKLYLDGNLEKAKYYLDRYLERAAIEHPDHRSFLAKILIANGD